MSPLIRVASRDDFDAIARLWHDAWHDAHTGVVEAQLLAHRGLEHFRKLAAERIGRIDVALEADQLVGFASVHKDELELLFVAAVARGVGAADRLIAHAEQRIGERFQHAYLLVVDGNVRARRFYERHGFRDVGLVAYEAAIPGGSISVPHRRYQKTLR